MRKLLFSAALVVLTVPLPAGAATNDPLFGRQWGLARVKAEAAWQTSNGGGTTIAVVDTGVDVGHPDLAGKVLMGTDFVNNDGDPQDDEGHGTHVAGIAAAMTGNGLGVAGVAPEAKILAIKVLDDGGSGSSTNVVRGIQEATTKGADVINLSLGDLLPAEILHDDRVDDAIRDAYAKGVVVVAAAGNNGFPFSNPATANVALVVGATGKDDQKAAYSTAGEGVKIWAPGGDGPPVVVCSQDPNIWSTVLRGIGECGQSDYDQHAGTSMAAPHVAGVAALVLSVKPSLSPKQVFDNLLNTADTVGALGLKRVNAAKAVAAVKSTGGGSSSGGSGSSGGGSGQPSSARGASGGRSGGASVGVAAATPTGVPGQPETQDTEGAEGDRNPSGGEKQKPNSDTLILNLILAMLFGAALIGAIVWARLRRGAARAD